MKKSLICFLLCIVIFDSQIQTIEAISFSTDASRSFLGAKVGSPKCYKLKLNKVKRTSEKKRKAINLIKKTNHFLKMEHAPASFIQAKSLDNQLYKIKLKNFMNT